MRTIGLLALATGALWGQSMTEAAAAAAGSTVGSVAGKQISAGVDKIFNKTGDVMKNAAKGGNQTKEPLIRVGPGRPKEEPHTVPPPPPPAATTSRSTTRRAAPPAPQLVARPEPRTVTYAAPAAPPPPPPPAMTREQLASIAAGTSRADVLAAGTPASRVTMFDNGHLVEIYRYQTRDTVLGVVRLQDGAVAEVDVRP